MVTYRSYKADLGSVTSVAQEMHDVARKINDYISGGDKVERLNYIAHMQYMYDNVFSQVSPSDVASFPDGNEAVAEIYDSFLDEYRYQLKYIKGAFSGTMEDQDVAYSGVENFKDFDYFYVPDSSKEGVLWLDEWFTTIRRDVEGRITTNVEMHDMYEFIRKHEQKLYDNTADVAGETSAILNEYADSMAENKSNSNVRSYRSYKADYSRDVTEGFPDRDARQDYIRWYNSLVSERDGWDVYNDTSQTWRYYGIGGTVYVKVDAIAENVISGELPFAFDCKVRFDGDYDYGFDEIDYIGEEIQKELPSGLEMYDFVQHIREGVYCTVKGSISSNAHPSSDEHIYELMDECEELTSAIIDAILDGIKNATGEDASIV